LLRGEAARTHSNVHEVEASNSSTKHNSSNTKVYVYGNFMCYCIESGLVTGAFQNLSATFVLTVAHHKGKRTVHSCSCPLEEILFLPWKRYTPSSQYFFLSIFPRGHHSPYRRHL
jgi:hypothetical protein